MPLAANDPPLDGFDWSLVRSFLAVLDAGLVALRDAETGALAWLDTSSARVRTEFERQTNARRERLRRAFSKCSVDHVEIVSGEDYVKELMKFFRGRPRRERRAA